MLNFLKTETSIPQPGMAPLSLSSKRKQKRPLAVLSEYACPRICQDCPYASCNDNDSNLYTLHCGLLKLMLASGKQQACLRVAIQVPACYLPAESSRKPDLLCGSITATLGNFPGLLEHHQRAWRGFESVFSKLLALVLGVLQNVDIF